MESKTAVSVNVQIRFPKELKTRLTRVATKRGLRVGDAIRLAALEFCERAESKNPQSELNL